MLGYASRRLLTTLPVILIAITAAFFILRLAPGGPFDQERALPPEVLANLRSYYHLDDPLIVQYFRYLVRLAHFDLGPSFVTKDFTVAQQITIGLPYTMTLGTCAFVLAVVLGITAGILGALYQNHAGDYLIAAVAMTGLVVPNFLTAPILQLVFGVNLAWLPVGGWGDGSIRFLIMPVTVLSLSHIARISRLMRGSMIETMNANFIKTAKAKGIGRRRTVLRHALRPALTPVVSYLGPAAGYLLTGSIVVESIFGIPGVGRYFVGAALNRDYGMVLGTVVFYMSIILVLNLLVDLAYAWLDPKVRTR
ncbi:ABC transporter permease subunit [Consotaella salsifontis]|uniref:Oligopeptide transport system permease protein n=1 Tax=Consotaella salsifontis TaxID=1365950 RepID=A0A1T4SX79_9HYPH|nr:ABC transporter permease subunit [Consotaella salsifontis]SKA32759.1 oligopeptide transport system permease protein [Consotaella salsifontis]